MKSISALVLVLLSFPSLGRALGGPEATPTRATMNFVNSLIFENMTAPPIWTSKVDYTSRESHRDSFVRKQGAVTCTAMKYVYPQYSGLQSKYQCELGAINMDISGFTFSGDAAELAYKGLASIFKGHDPFKSEVRPNAMIHAPVLGKMKTVVRSWVCETGQGCVPSVITAVKEDDNGFYDAIISCGRPGELSVSHGGGEFFEAEKAGVLPPFRLSSYACHVNLN